MARSAQTPARSAGGISGKRLRKTGVEREEGPASRAGIDRVRIVRLKLLIVLVLELVLVLDFFLIYTRTRPRGTIDCAFLRSQVAFGCDGSKIEDEDEYEDD